MKKLFGGIKKNIFYISLIAGMAVLVTVLGLYNAKMNSKEKNMVTGQNTTGGDTLDSDGITKETLSGKDKSVQYGTYDDGIADDKDLAAEQEDEEYIDGEDAVETIDSEKSSSVVEKALHYDPSQNSISWPLVGNVIIPYSMDTTVYFETLEVYKCSPAMIIEAQEGAEVKAVYECKVSEVSSSPELGNYIKLDLGDGYVVTLGQLEDVKVALGDTLHTGQVVGTVGQPSRFYSEEGTNLYFSIEKDGQPVDPTLLIQ